VSENGKLKQQQQQQQQLQKLQLELKQEVQSTPLVWHRYKSQ